jgi:hypothetical protein
VAPVTAGTSRGAGAGGRVTVWGIYAQTARTFAREAGFLLLVGALVFVPLGLLDAAADRVGAIHIEHIGDISNLALAALIIGFIVQSTTSLLGEVFYSGAVALTLSSEEHGHRPSLREIARTLSYGRLIAVDIVFGIAVALGLVLLVAPGVVAFTWFALAGPVVELEDEGVRASFARSRRLVSGRFWTVLAILAPIVLASEVLAGAILTWGHGVIGNPFLSDWFAECLANMLTSPFYAVAAVLLTLELRRSRG